MRRIRTILLVDDDETTNFLHQRLLFRLNVSDRVLVARNGAQALKILTQPNARFNPTNPVLVLLDLNMPVVDGFEFLKAFQALPSVQQRSAVVVVLTSSLNTQDMDRSNNLPVAGFLTKPLDKVKIDSLLHLHFGSPVAAE
ncbi:response regulator [Hymenobacter sp. BT683]|uniref:Response regulator n=1 Tax=Hymenobacter jeongseonensis TaxID=2791027 RepID=A0ABS0IMP3_9BACT|nr:response regulator [Hymenobacter jeongseonensis]MBF9239649.1 response regulator [Hymenobacter jeongseonensis]